MAQCWQLVADQHLWSFHFIASTLSLSLINLLIVFGNGLVITAVIINKNLHTTTNYIIMSLATSDFLLGIAVLPFSISQEIFAAVWLFSSQWCQIWLATDVCLCTASIYNLVAISFDRYMAVRHPLKYKLVSSHRMGKRLVIFSWLIAFVICLPPVVAPFFNETEDDEGIMIKNQSEHCECTPMNNDSIYIIYSAMGSFFIPLLLIMILNIRIYSTIRKAGKKRNEMSAEMSSLPSNVPRKVTKMLEIEPPSVLGSMKVNNGVETPDSPLPTPEPPRKTRKYQFGCKQHRDVSLLLHNMDANDTKKTHSSCVRRKRWARKRAQEEIKVVKTVSVVVGCFVICWLPFFVIYVLQAYDLCTIATGCVPGIMFSIAFWLGYCNSALNPIIYALFSRDLRCAFQSVLKKIAKLCTRPPKRAISTSSATMWSMIMHKDDVIL